MKIKTTGGDFEQPPTGTHLAICVGMVGIGTRWTEYQGKRRERTEVMLTWELPNELMDTGKPFTVSNWYTRSMHEQSSLRNALINWRTRDFTEAELADFDLKAVLGKPCTLTLVKNDKGKVRVGTVSGLPKGMTVPKPVNELRHFDVEEWNDDDFNKLSDRVKDMIRDSREFAAMQSSDNGALPLDYVEPAWSGDGVEEDAIPF